MAKVTSENPALDSPSERSMSDSAAPIDSAESAIEVNNLNAWYGDFQALHSIHLSIPKNRVTAFIGPSGCGKSTLLRWINRMNDTILSARATGTLRLGDLDLLAKSTDVVDLRRRVGIVFQKPNPFPKSIYENRSVWTSIAHEAAQERT